MRQLDLKKNLNNVGDCIIYIMSRDQRINDNHALLYAQKLSLEKALPIVILFNFTPNVGVRAREHYSFMINGLKEIEKKCERKKISFVLTIGEPITQISSMLNRLNPQEVIFDFSPLKNIQKTQKKIVNTNECSFTIIDTHNIIPTWLLSDKEEYAAHTIRRKVHKQLANWLIEPEKIMTNPYQLKCKIPKNNWRKVDILINSIKSNGSKIEYVAGEQAAQLGLKNFILYRLDAYATQRNLPTNNGQSNLSPYLHFGHLSSLRITLNILNSSQESPLLFKEGKLPSIDGEPSRQDSINIFLEELIVRKELADNFCYFNNSYDSLIGAKNWAQESLSRHNNDVRDYNYELKDWINASTHDLAWNASQQELMRTGKMHGYMRMYWAKKILEWSETPELAIQTAIFLNDHYSIDGGDPNGYTGIMWSIAGVHDRPWFERKVFGKIRYMNLNGLKRRFDVEKYINQWK
ncbi:MAG: deoxyribodipyrimidine photo-lyase [Dehalococcoidia bacterium]|jgi:deoxyribodipyrimidine photo-lyase|nr:deoxyribodipyrimidine photo-lyase [Dehalococcoidia bacterium]